jgi:phage gp45-like
MPQIGKPQTGLDRTANGIGRAFITATDDTKLWQEVTHKGHQNEQADTIEHAHPYGFTSRVQPPSNGKGAEGIVVYPTGDRSHGVTVVNGDRRYRLYKLANGEVALHDDLGHQIHMSRTGIVASAPNSKNITLQIMESDALPQDQKYAQVQQKGRPTVATFVLNAKGLTINAPQITLNATGGALTMTASGTTTLTAPNIKINGNVDINS